jgi:hypothetical protein
MDVPAHRVPPRILTLDPHLAGSIKSSVAQAAMRSWQQSDSISFVSGFAWDLPAGGFACWKLPLPNRIAL